MRYVAILVIAAASYLYFSAHGPKVPGVNAPSPTPGTDFLKRPLDRTEEVLKQARTRANDPALQ